MKQTRYALIMFVSVLVMVACGGTQLPEPVLQAQPARPSPTAPPIPTAQSSPTSVDALQEATVAPGQQAYLVYGSLREGVMGIYLLSEDNRAAATFGPRRAPAYYLARHIP